MNRFRTIALFGVAGAFAVFANGAANATEPCGDFGECKVLVEINSSDGDIGFHFLVDGDNLISTSLFNPKHRKIFTYRVRRELRKQYLTETFAESAEPLCFDPMTDDDPENDDEDFVTLEDFLDRWNAGTYRFFGISDGWEFSFGQTELTFDLPAAPINLQWIAEDEGGDIEYEIAWEAGNDLGECSDGIDLLPTPPANVPVKSWEVVLVPDVDGPLGALTYVVRLPGDTEELEVEVPDDYLESLPPNTPGKMEVGAIGMDDNATFTEAGDICLNEMGEGCDFDE